MALEPEGTGTEAPVKGADGTAPEDKSGMTPEELAEHKERSGLGRRVSDMESKMTEFMEGISTAVSKLEVLGTPVQGGGYGGIYTPEPLNTDGDDVMTRNDFISLLDERDKAATTKQLKYEKDYLVHVNKLKGVGLEMHDEIVKEMMANFNIPYSGDGEADADRNYYKAVKAVTDKGIKTNPLKGNDNPPALGVGGTTEQDASKGGAMPKLDKFAQDYVNTMGLDAKFVEEALKEED